MVITLKFLEEFAKKQVSFFKIEIVQDCTIATLDKVIIRVCMITRCLESMDTRIIKFKKSDAGNLCRKHTVIHSIKK